MKNAILAWYAYAASGAAGRGEIWDDPEQVVELFSDARRFDAAMTPAGWRRLWERYGLEGLIDLARRGDWPDSAGDDEVARALIEQSLACGYDPVSGEFGQFDDRLGMFDVVGAGRA